MRNLVENAIEHGGRYISIEVRKHRSTAELSVSDNGIGITDGNVERVFALYESANAPVGLTRNLGLGLTAARALAEYMGGTLRYMRGGGTTVFTLHLPLAQAA